MSPYPPLPPSMSHLQEKAIHSLEVAHQAKLKNSVARQLESIDKQEFVPTGVTYPEPGPLYLLCYVLRMYVMDMIFAVFWGCICLTTRRREARLLKADTALSKPTESFSARFLVVNVFGKTISLSLSSLSLKEHVFASILATSFLMGIKLPMVTSTCSTIAIVLIASYFLVTVLRLIFATPTQPSTSSPSPGRRVSVSHGRSAPKIQSWFPSTMALSSACFVFGFSCVTCLIIHWSYCHTNAFGPKTHPAPAPDAFQQYGVPYTISKATGTHSYFEDDRSLQANPWFIVRATALMAAATLVQILFQNRRHPLRIRDRRIRDVKIAAGYSSSRRTSGVRLRIPDGWNGQLLLVVACVIWSALPRWAAFLSLLVTGHLVLTHRVMAGILKQAPALPFLKRSMTNTLPIHTDIKAKLEVLAYNLVLCPVLQWMMRHYDPKTKKTRSQPPRSPCLARIATNATTTAMSFIKAFCYCLYNCSRTQSHILTKSPLSSFTTKNALSVPPGSGGQDSILNPMTHFRKGRRGNRGLIRISTA